MTSNESAKTVNTITKDLNLGYAIADGIIASMGRNQEACLALQDIAANLKGFAVFGLNQRLRKAHQKGEISILIQHEESF